MTIRVYEYKHTDVIRGWLQRGRKWAVTLPDQTLSLTCRFVYMEAVPMHCSRNKVFWPWKSPLRSQYTKITNRTATKWRQSKRLTVHVLIWHSIWPVGLLRKKNKNKRHNTWSQRYSLIYQKERPPLFENKLLLTDTNDCTTYVKDRSTSSTSILLNRLIQSVIAHYSVNWKHVKI